MTIDNLIIDRVLHGTFYDKSSGEGLFRLTQIQNASLSNTSEAVDVLDATGVLITQLDRSKAATFSGESALKDMHLLAAQAGTELESGSDTNKITVPAFDIISTKADKTEYDLKHLPLEGVVEAYILTPGGAMGDKLTIDSSAGEKKIQVSSQKATVVFNQPEKTEDGTTTPAVKGTCNAGDSILFLYDYETVNAVQFVNKADQFNVPMHVVIEALAYEPCAIDEKIYVLIDFPSAKLSSTFDFALSPEEAQSFELQCLVDYCSAEKTLYKVIVVDD